jgi:fatty-acyl-CoA synthase
LPVACVTGQSEAKVEAVDLKAHAQLQLARFKVPREIIFVEELPRTALGKVQHFMLKQYDVQSHVQGDAS